MLRFLRAFLRRVFTKRLLIFYQHIKRLCDYLSVSKINHKSRFRVFMFCEHIVRVRAELYRNTCTNKFHSEDRPSKLVIMRVITCYAPIPYYCFR